jgi:carbon-monoxide dehydrogenase large subunit
MEPRAAVGEWDAASGRYTVHAGAAAWGGRATGVAGALGVPESAVRVVAGDVGGNFGRATAAIRSSRSSPGRRDAWAGR